MITDNKKWHYLVVKSLSALFRRKTVSIQKIKTEIEQKINLKSIKTYVKIMIIAI